MPLYLQNPPQTNPTGAFSRPTWVGGTMGPAPAVGDEYRVQQNMMRGKGPMAAPMAGATAGAQRKKKRPAWADMGQQPQQQSPF